MSRDDGKREKTHREKKNYRGHADYLKRKEARNQARPKQRFLGIDLQGFNPATGKLGIGLGWARP